MEIAGSCADDHHLQLNQPDQGAASQAWQIQIQGTKSQVPEAWPGWVTLQLLLPITLDYKEMVCVVETHYSSPPGSGRLRDFLERIISFRKDGLNC